MTQTPSYAIANDSGAAVRLRLNEILAAVQSMNAGPVAPPSTRPGMFWFDTSQTPPVLRIRNAGDSGWDIGSAHLDVVDTRRAGARVPDDYASRGMFAEFTDKITRGWHAALTVKGWLHGYALWQIIGYADTRDHEHLYVRFGKGNAWQPLRKLWHEGNDGAGSGLDADLLDGQEGAYYRNAGHLNAGILPHARLPKASQREARGGTDNTKAMTSLRVAEAIVAQAPQALPRLTAGDAIRSRRDAEQSTHANGYTTLHSFSFLQAGTVRVSFQMKAAATSTRYPVPAARILRRRNGVDMVIQEWSRTSAAFATYSADVAVQPGDTVFVQALGKSGQYWHGRENQFSRTAVYTKTNLRNIRFMTGRENLLPGSEAILEGNSHD